MKSAIVKASELGYKCWSAFRFLNKCCKCQRYDKCEYPERVADEYYDRLRRKLGYFKYQVAEVTLAIKLYLER